MKIKVSDNGVFFFREKKDGTKMEFIKLIENLNKSGQFLGEIDLQDAGNMAVIEFIKKYSKKLNNQNEQSNITTLQRPEIRNQEEVQA